MVGTQDMKNFLDLAIFADSFAVAGDKQMLIDLKEFLYSKVQNDIFMAYFAKSTTTFETPTTISTLWVKENFINIKKLQFFQ